MKNEFLISFICVIGLISLSCTEEISLDLNQLEQKTVIQALITDQPGPYFVRLTKTTNALNIPYNPVNGDYYDQAVIIENAMITISDNLGNIDTLIPSPYHNYIVVSGGDSLMGYYCTTSLQGVVGRTYQLNVKVEGKEFKAESTMLPAPIIDTLFFNISPGDIGKEDKVVPIAKLNEIDIDDKYFLFTTGFELNTIRYSSLIFSLVETNNSNYVTLFNDGSPEGLYYNDPGLYFDTTQFNIYSLNSEAYEFHKSIIRQFNSDGGAYRPAPATPPGSFGEDAIGVFQVSSVKSYKAILEFYY